MGIGISLYLEIFIVLSAVVNMMVTNKDVLTFIQFGIEKYIVVLEILSFGINTYLSLKLIDFLKKYEFNETILYEISKYNYMLFYFGFIMFLFGLPSNLKTMSMGLSGVFIMICSALIYKKLKTRS